VSWINWNHRNLILLNYLITFPTFLPSPLSLPFFSPLRLYYNYTFDTCLHPIFYLTHLQKIEYTLFILLFPLSHYLLLELSSNRHHACTHVTKHNTIITRSVRLMRTTSFHHLHETARETHPGPTIIGAHPPNILPIAQFLMHLYYELNNSVMHFFVFGFSSS